MRNFRKMEIGRTSFFQETTTQMVKEFMDSLVPVKSNEGNVVKVDQNFALCTGKILWRLLVGSQTPQDDRDCEKFFYANEKWVDNGGFGDGVLMIAPFLKHFFSSCHRIFKSS